MISQKNNSTTVLSPGDQRAKMHAIIAYVLMIIGFFTGVFWFVGALWATVKRDCATGSSFYGHYKNIISTFWTGLIFSVIGYLLIILLIGYVILFVTWILSIYRIVKGLANLVSDKPYA